MKAVVSLEEAKAKLLELYQKNNPDITEIEIEGIPELGHGQRISKETDTVFPTADVATVTPIVEPPPPDVEEMMKLAASLQNVVDEGTTYSVKYLKGRNKGITWTVSKELVNQCRYCPYIAMDDNDQQTHRKTYHKEQWKAERDKEQRQLEIAKQQKQERIEQQLGPQRWGKKRGQS